MELILLLVIIVILIIYLNSVGQKIDGLQASVNQLKESLRKMAAQLTEQPEVKPIEKKIEVPKVVIHEPTINPKPVEKEVVREVPKPQVFENKAPEKIQEVKPIQPIIPQKTWWERFREKNPDLEKFVGENLISKIGILILVLGISYFVKFAIDKDWINEPARAGIGILCGAILMAVAHRLRKNFKAFSSVLAAGAIAVLYFTIAISFHQYHLFSQTIAFVLMVLITAFSVLISVSYDRMELAILSLIGGFAVPFMLSTGEGNYKVLFTYIAILDIGILAVALIKHWRLVNILAFAFTMLLYSGWLSIKVVDHTNAPYFGAFIFATLFYIIFTLVNIVNNLKTKGAFNKGELIILIINTFLYFSFGMIIFQFFHPEFKGVFTIALALSNLFCAWFLYKKFGLDKNAIYLFLGLTLTFVTLAVPLQFSGNYITLFWAAEAVLLLWLSQKSNIAHFRFTSILVHGLMLGSLFMDWGQIYIINGKASFLLNEAFIAGIFATISLFAVGLLTKNETENLSLFKITIHPKKYHKRAIITGLIILYFTGLFETGFQSEKHFPEYYSSLAVIALYHLLFCSIIVFLLQRSQQLIFQKVAVIIGLINIPMYVLLLSSIPFGELRNQLVAIKTVNTAFILHYFSLGCILYQGLVIWKRRDTMQIIQRPWFLWAVAVSLIYILSNEVLLHGIKFSTEVIAPDAKNSNLAYINYGKSQIFNIKVLFPILWGLIAILFLTIGIKKQFRNLRIIALTLLGITIIKLFVYDISNASETGKIIAFILLGIMILVMSFAYQKIRKIVLENEQAENIEDDEK